jgi:hypothetical protein
MGGATNIVTAVVGAVVGFFVGGPVGAVVGFAAGYASGDIVNAIINPGFDVPNFADSSASAAQNDGISVNKQGTNLNIPVIYGRRRVGGNRVFVSTEGATNEYLHIVLVLAEGEIHRITEIYADDVIAWSGSSSHGERYAANQGKFTGLMDFEVYHGTPNQVASPLTLGVGGWSPQHQLKGLAYISFRLKWLKIEKAEDRDASPWNGLPNFTVVVDGKKIADAGTFANTKTRGTAYESESTVYNNNPVNCLLDYLRNPVYGKGLSNDKIDFASFKAEAARWTYLADGSTPATGDQFHECNAVIFTDRTIMDNTKAFLFNMRAALPYQGGRFSVRVEDNRNDTSTYGTSSTAVMTIGEDAIIGAINLESESVAGKYNSVTVTYMGGRQGSVLTNESVDYTYPEIDTGLEAQYLAEDNNRVNEFRFTLEHVSQDSIAKKYAEVALKKSRYRGKVVTFTGDASLHQLQVNDIFTLNYSGLGINGKFRVKSLQFNSDYTFSVIAEEHNDLVYGGNVEPFRRRTPVQVATGDNIPYYRDLVTGNTVHYGNKSDAPLTIITSPGGPSYTLPVHVPGPVQQYTYAELEAGLAAGNVIGVVNGEIIYATPVFIPKPVITGYEVSTSSQGSQYREVKLLINPTNEPNIEVTNFLYFWPKYSNYELLPSGNQLTAAKNGYVLAGTWNTFAWKTVEMKVQWTGKGGALKESSNSIVVDLTTLGVNRTALVQNF